MEAPQHRTWEEEEAYQVLHTLQPYQSNRATRFVEEAAANMTSPYPCKIDHTRTVFSKAILDRVHQKGCIKYNVAVSRDRRRPNYEMDFAGNMIYEMYSKMLPANERPPTSATKPKIDLYTPEYLREPWWTPERKERLRLATNVTFVISSMLFSFVCIYSAINLLFERSEIVWDLVFRWTPWIAVLFRDAAQHPLIVSITGSAIGGFICTWIFWYCFIRQKD